MPTRSPDLPLDPAHAPSTPTAPDDARVDELGAHISTAGGVERAPARAAEIGAVVLQLFTKQPNRWAEPVVDADRARAWKAASDTHHLATRGSHDSYLINLASPDPELREKSFRSFRSELERCEALALDFLVTHPGNATDGDAASGVARNADLVARALDEVPGRTRILLEITAGSGTSVGGTFEQLAAILEGIPTVHQPRVGICFDTCHAFSAGYDLVHDYDGVWTRFDEVLGLDRLGLFHLNDSKHPFDSRKDRHEHIGQGSLGEGPFRRLMTDERFQAIPKVLETPKGDDMVTLDRENLARLRSYRD